MDASSPPEQTPPTGSASPQSDQSPRKSGFPACPGKKNPARGRGYDKDNNSDFGWTSEASFPLRTQAAGRHAEHYTFNGFNNKGPIWQPSLNH